MSHKFGVEIKVDFAYS